jgi:hypothetical protein
MRTLLQGMGPRSQCIAELLHKTKYKVVVKAQQRLADYFEYKFSSYTGPSEIFGDINVHRAQDHLSTALLHEMGHFRLGHTRETKRAAVSRSASTSTSAVSATSTGSEGNGDGGGDDGGGGDGEDGGGGDDDDPADIAHPLPVVDRVVSPGSFLRCVLLAGTAWLFKDSFLAAIPLIGLCALCAFPESLQFIRCKLSAQEVDFEIRRKE